MRKEKSSGNADYACSSLDDLLIIIKKQDELIREYTRVLTAVYMNHLHYSADRLIEQLADEYGGDLLFHIAPFRNYESTEKRKTK